MKKFLYEAAVVAVGMGIASVVIIPAAAFIYGKINPGATLPGQ